jgi:hypothetical protein
MPARGWPYGHPLGERSGVLFGPEVDGHPGGDRGRDAKPPASTLIAVQFAAGGPVAKGLQPALHRRELHERRRHPVHPEQAVYQQMVDAGLKFGVETPLPTVRFEDLALTSTRSADNTGVRVQVLRRQPDGSWLRIIDRPEVPQP